MRRIVLAVLLATIVGVSAPAPASAASGEKITIRIENNDKVSKKYAGMPVNEASSEFAGDPETCKAAPFCTTVPMDVLLPANFNPDINEFVLKVVLSWNDQGLSANGQSAQGNDLDMYIYHQEKDAKGATVYKETGRAAGSRQPEIAKLFTPSRKNYFIVIYNFLGVNTGFQLDVSYRDASVKEVGEFGGSAAAGASESASNSAEDSSDSGGSFEPDTGASPSFTRSAARPTPGSPSLLPITPDGFSSNGGLALPAPTAPDDSSVFDLPAGSARDLASDLAPNETQDVFKTRVAEANPDPPSGVLLGFWFGVVPLVLVAAAAVFMLRRRPAALTLSLPRSSTA